MELNCTTYWDEVGLLSTCRRLCNTSTPYKISPNSNITRRHSESSNPRRIAVNPNSNVDLSTQNHVTRRISQGHSLYQVWTLWDHSFLSYAADISVKPYPNLGLWPVPQTIPLAGYPKVIAYTKFEHFGMIRFCVMLRTNKKRTQKQTDSNILPTPTDSWCW